ncbi:MAG: hypothetical protein QG656_224, partial [Candidatus Hydrogenedentes bacterium]|nr:hypothetical protein [Candidatus Hydrogenedentota bacterium]
MNRREFLKSIGISAASLALASHTRLARAADLPSKPNIIVIMSDEHNAKVMGCAGNSIVKTPNL